MTTSPLNLLHESKKPRKIRKK